MLHENRLSFKEELLFYQLIKRHVLVPLLYLIEEKKNLISYQSDWASMKQTLVLSKKSRLSYQLTWGHPQNDTSTVLMKKVVSYRLIKIQPEVAEVGIFLEERESN